MKKKALVFIGSRATYGRLKMIMLEMMKNYKWLDFKIFLASSGVYIGIDGFEVYVDYKIDGLMYKDSSANMSFTTATVLEHAANYLQHKKFDFCIIHGDRYESLGMALACFHQGVPIAHTEGGELSGTYDNTVRYLISSIAKWHFVTTKKSKQRLNFYNNVHNIGSPTIDMVFNTLDRRTTNNDDPYAVVLYNPSTNIEDKEQYTMENVGELIKVVDILAKKIKIIWVNPNVDPGNKDLLKKIHRMNISFQKDIKPDEYIRLLDKAYLLIGNTSSGIKEGAAIGIPYILIGDRQKNREVASNVTRVALNCNEIVDIANLYIGYEQQKIIYDGTFGNGMAAQKFIRIMKSVLNSLDIKESVLEAR